MEVVTGIVTIVLLITFVFFWLSLGEKDKIIQEKEKALQQKAREYKTLRDKKVGDLSAYESRKSSLETSIAEKESQIKRLEERYETTRNMEKMNNNDLAEKHRLKVEALDKEYQEKMLKLDENYTQTAETLTEQIAIIKTELEKLKATKAATVEAFQREQIIKDQQDSYRLKLSEEEENDIKLLRSIQYRLSKPRILAMLIWQTFYQPKAKKQFPIILGSKKICGVYKITNIENEKCYCGQASDCYKRWSDHCKAGLGIDTPQGNKLYAAMKEDGLSNFTFELLEECAPEELNEKERYYIGLYNAVDYGYNSQAGNK